MKRTLFFLFAILSLYCFAQDQFPKNENGIYTLEKVENISGLSKNEIFKKAIQFLTTKYQFSQFSIQYKDEDSGKIIGKGEIKMPPSKYNGLIGHIIEIDVKDGKYKYKIYNLSFRYLNNYAHKTEDISYPFETMPNFMGYRKKIFEDSFQSLNQFTKELYAFIDSKNDW